MSDDLEFQLDQLADDVEDLQGRVAFSSHKESIAELEANLPDLIDRIERIRQRGYPYKAYLLNKAETLQTKWADAKPKVEAEMRKAEQQAKPIVDDVETKLTRAKRLKRASSVESLEDEVSQAETKLRELDDAISAHYSEVQTAYYQTESQVRGVEWTLDQLDEATFTLLAEERPIEAVKSQWYRDGKKKGPEGVLYLTDQRLIFEQKEKIATKKVLFIATEKEMVQEKVFEESVTTVEKVVPSSQGIIREHTLDFTFGHGANYGNVVFRVKGDDPKMWASLIKRVNNGQIQAERYYAEGEQAEQMAAFEDALTNAPAECSACGAPVPAISQGQRQVQCEYCGTSMKW